MITVHYIEIIVYTVLMLGLGCVLGWVHQRFVTGLGLPMILSQSKVTNTPSPEPIKIFITESSGQFLLYDLDTHEFLLQASSYQELDQKVQTQYPGLCVRLVDGQLIIGHK